jgi:hypothetical protein
VDREHPPGLLEEKSLPHTLCVGDWCERRTDEAEEACGGDDPAVAPACWMSCHDPTLVTEGVCLSRHRDRLDQSRI